MLLSWYIFLKAGVYGFIGAVLFNLGAADLFKIYIWRKAPYSKLVTWCSLALCAVQGLVSLIIIIYPFWYKSKIISAYEASITSAKLEFGSDVTVLYSYYTEGNFMIWIILLFAFLYMLFSVSGWIKFQRIPDPQSFFFLVFESALCVLLQNTISLLFKVHSYLTF